jgi:hypothetical protein
MRRGAPKGWGDSWEPSTSKGRIRFDTMNRSSRRPEALISLGTRSRSQLRSAATKNWFLGGTAGGRYVALTGSRLYRRLPIGVTARHVADLRYCGSACR